MRFFKLTRRAFIQLVLQLVFAVMTIENPNYVLTLATLTTAKSIYNHTCELGFCVLFLVTQT